MILIMILLLILIMIIITDINNDILCIFSETRRNFIVEKYTNRKYIEHQVEPSVLNQELLEAIELRDIKHLLQVSTCTLYMYMYFIHVHRICYRCSAGEKEERGK